MGSVAMGFKLREHQMFLLVPVGNGGMDPCSSSHIIA